MVTTLKLLFGNLFWKFVQFDLIADSFFASSIAFQRDLEYDEASNEACYLNLIQ